ncbi:hypothetical protein [Tautonia sociabilis]|uniref:Uncharacterized protein n=1 Tax=Tautonia sociabilis TaxID=2080755 RepID=A0A432MIH9_9BACT|nr:hypothetical protein [Tautonia sociabilis]RUL87172.1 hypothetical protein TsocGM_13930 [Tautonia sociabilis]
MIPPRASLGPALLLSACVLLVGPGTARANLGLGFTKYSMHHKLGSLGVPSVSTSIVAVTPTMAIAPSMGVSTFVPQAVPYVSTHSMSIASPIMATSPMVLTAPMAAPVAMVPMVGGSSAQAGLASAQSATSALGAAAASSYPIASSYVLVPTTFGGYQGASYGGANPQFIGVGDVISIIRLIRDIGGAIGGGGSEGTPAPGGNQEVTIRIIVEVQQPGAASSEPSPSDPGASAVQLQEGDRISESLGASTVRIERNGQTLEARKDNPGLQVGDVIEKVGGKAGDEVRLYTVRRGGDRVDLRADGSAS